MKRITNPETQWDVLGEVYNAVDRLREIENIIGDNYDLEHLKELVKSYRIETERCEPKTMHSFGRRWTAERNRGC